MYLKYIGFCVILFLLDGGFAVNVGKGKDITINCDTKQSSVITFWFHINRNGVKYLFTVRGTDLKNSEVNEEKYKVNLNSKVSLTIKSFEKKTDSGSYTCAAMNNNKLIFGEQTEVQGEPDPATPSPKKDAPTTTISKPVMTTKSQCNCPNKDPKSSINCETWILSSLASGCGVFLLSLIFTILYCNRLRTRRCPHHYKRQPRPAGHAKLPNNHF